MESLALGERAFPVTFSVSAPGRAGELSIGIDALDPDGRVVGHGATATTTDAAQAALLLEATDFVVNTDFANDQFPSADFEASGFQVAAAPDGTWTAVFRDACTAGSCGVYARRFTADGKPVSTAIAAGTNAFALTTTPTTTQTTPAVAASATTTLAVWEAYPVGGPAAGVACRALDVDGRATASQLAIAADAADVVAVTALPTGNFAASWNATVGGDGVVRTVFVRPDCTALTAVQTVSATPGVFAHRASLAASGDRVLFAWVVDGSLHVRLASTAGALITADTVLAAKTATEQVVHARVAPTSGGGFVVATRWALNTLAAGAGRLELVRVSAAGAAIGAPVLVTDRSGSDSANRESFGLAGRGDGSLLLAWHTCDALGDDSQCGVFGRILRDTGEPISAVQVLATTTLGDQRRPSAAALPGGFVAIWTDASARPPDVSGLAVRARVIYPPRAAQLGSSSAR